MTYNQLIKLLITTSAFAVSICVQALNFDQDVPQNIQQQMVEDLTFISQIKGSGQTQFHTQIYGQVDGKDYTQFFTSRIQNIGMNTCGSSNAVACVIPMANPHKMWLTQNFIKFSHPQIARSMVVFHEARHSEVSNGFWSHDTCPTPFLDANGKDMVSIWTGAKLEGQPACDSTAFGSYGSSTIMLKNIAKFCANCADKVKMDADIYSNDQLGRIDKPDVKQSMLNDFKTAMLRFRNKR